MEQPPKKSKNPRQIKQRKMNSPHSSDWEDTTAYRKRRKLKKKKIRSENNILFSKLKYIAISAGVAGLFIAVGLALTKPNTPLSEPSPQAAFVDPESPIPSPVPVPASSSTDYPTEIELPQPIAQNLELVPIGDVSPPNSFQDSPQLQEIVDEVVTLAAIEGFPTEDLSVSLINLKDQGIAGYQEQQLRYPASVVKLFWVVYLYAQIQQGKWQSEREFTQDLYKMIERSDNEAASRILDAMTGTRSGEPLNAEEFNKWLNKRQAINRFFQEAGYKHININQKTFPIPYLDLPLPKGRDLQMRGNPEDPIRNKISTEQAAKLMYTIANGQAVSPEYSERMGELLTIDLQSGEWKDIAPNSGRFDPVRRFFGELLPSDVTLMSKAGWTSQTRQEVAFVASPDGQAVYVLSIFAEDSAYAESQTIFPKMSRLVYDRMTRLY